MIQLGREQVRPISRYTWEEFSKWLRTGLELHFWPDEEADIRPFHPLNDYIGLGEDLTDDLASIYNALPPTAQASFREAVAGALLGLPESDRYFKIFTELMYLGGAIRAYEILPVVESRVGKGFFGFPDMPEAREAFIVALDIVAGMAESDTKNLSLKCLQKLVNSRFFQHDYADMALLALCHVDEDAFPKHLESLRGYFRKVIEDGIPAENLRDLARQFVETVGLPCIAKHIAKVELINQQGDYWLVKALFEGKTAPLEIIEHLGVMKIQSRLDSKKHAEEIAIQEDDFPASRQLELRKFLPLPRKPKKPNGLSKRPKSFREAYSEGLRAIGMFSQKTRPQPEHRV